MSTRSYIGKQNKDGSIKYVYCHSDGYINGGVGEMLFKNYKSEKKIDKLLALGDLSCLGKTPNSPDTCDYHRYNGEAIYTREASNIKSFGKKTVDNPGIEYVYLYQDGQWNVWDYDHKEDIAKNRPQTNLARECAM